jgi:hypothetical protein
MMSERDPMRDQWNMLANDPVVWVDDATPYTAEQVNELLIENARLSAELARLRAVAETLAGACREVRRRLAAGVECEVVEDDGGDESDDSGDEMLCHFYGALIETLDAALAEHAALAAAGPAPADEAEGRGDG